MSEPLSTDPMVAALLRERASYVSRAMDGRVRAVDEQLALRGYVVGAVEEKPERLEPAYADADAGHGVPRGRRAPSKRTAAARVADKTNQEDEDSL